MRRLMMSCTLALFTLAEIIGMQRRIREVGRIRLGVQGVKDGKRFPKKINRFRLTSADRQIIEAVAARYGGTAKAWDNGGVEQYEAITDATAMPILLPPNPTDLGFSQHWESWAKGFCVKRCDGLRDAVRDVPCDCDPDDRECKATSRLSVILPEIAGLGVWRLESHGYNAAVELAAAVEMIEALVGVRSMVPARLRLEVRETRRLIDGDAVVRRFVVPVLDLDTSVAQVQAAAAGVAPARHTGAGPAEESREISATPGWKPVAALAPAEGPVLSVEQQLADHDNAPPKPKRSNSRAPLPSTGRKARARQDSPTAEICAICAEPYGGLPVVQNRNQFAHDGKVSRFVHRQCQQGIDDAEAIAARDGEAIQPELSASQEPGGREEEASEPDSSPVDVPTGPDADPLSAADALTASPPLARGGPRMPTAKMHKQIFALLADVFPIPPGTPEADDRRRDTEIALCEAVGTPGITSHKDVTFATAQLLIDALVGIQEGTLSLTVEEKLKAGEPGRMRLARTETGEPVDFNEEGDE